MSNYDQEPVIIRYLYYAFKNLKLEYELILKNVNSKDVSLLSDIAKRLDIEIEKRVDGDIYGPAFVAKIERSIQQAENKVVKIDLNEIWK